MKYVIFATALIALIGFVSSTHAADPKPKPGHFVKVEDKVVTYKGGKKGLGEEHKVTLDDKTKITIDGKDGKVEDIKAGEFVEVTATKEGVAIEIAASSVPPAGPTTKPSTKPSVPPAK